MLLRNRYLKILTWFAALMVASLVACVPAARKLPSELLEVSGAARASSGYLLLNDSGNPSVVYTFKKKQGLSDSLNLEVKNRDWEGLAKDDSKTCICDIGDNRRHRETIEFYFLKSGDFGGQQSAVYPNHPHDAEACFFRNGKLFLLTKPKTGRSSTHRTSYLYEVPDNASQRTLVLVDSLATPKRSITDAVMVDDSRLAFIAYEFDFFGPFPYSRTNVYTVELDDQNHFKRETLRTSPVRAPFTLTQYEAIALADDAEHVIIFSEETAFIPARWRRVALP